MQFMIIDVLKYLIDLVFCVALDRCLYQADPEQREFVKETIKFDSSRMVVNCEKVDISHLFLNCKIGSKGLILRDCYLQPANTTFACVLIVR